MGWVRHGRAIDTHPHRLATRPPPAHIHTSHLPCCACTECMCAAAAPPRRHLSCVQPPRPRPPPVLGPLLPRLRRRPHGSPRPAVLMAALAAASASWRCLLPRRLRPVIQEARSCRRACLFVLARSVRCILFLLAECSATNNKNGSLANQGASTLLPNPIRRRSAGAG